MITCAACGNTSRDTEFCDHCNADLSPPASSLPPARCPLLDDGQDLSPDEVGQLARPESCILVRSEETSWRVHWISESVWPTWQPFVEERLASPLPVLPR